MSSQVLLYNSSRIQFRAYCDFRNVALINFVCVWAGSIPQAFGVLEGSGTHLVTHLAKFAILFVLS